MKNKLFAIVLIAVLAISCKKEDVDNLNQYRFEIWSDSPTDIKYYDEKGATHSVYLAKYEWSYDFEAEKVNAYCRALCKTGDFSGKLFKNGVVVNSFTIDHTSKNRIQYLHGNF